MASSTTRFTETLREAAGEQWDRVITHKFTKELAAGTIDRNGMRVVMRDDAVYKAHHSLTLCHLAQF